MSKILVRSTTITPREITTKNGTKMVFREQSAAILKDGEDFPHPFRLTLDDTQPPYPAGEYIVDAASFKVGTFENLEVGRRVVLVPFVPATAPAPVK